MTSWPATVEIASKSWPLCFGEPGLARPHADVLHDHVVRDDVDPPRMSVMPGDGAVCPAMVRYGSAIFTVRRRDR